MSSKRSDSDLLSLINRTVGTQDNHICVINAEENLNDACNADKAAHGSTQEFNNDNHGAHSFENEKSEKITPTAAQTVPSQESIEQVGNIYQMKASSDELDTSKKHKPEDASSKSSKSRGFVIDSHKQCDSDESTTRPLTDMTKDDVIQELLETRKLLETTKKRLARTERHLEKSDTYNNTLRSMIDQLSGDLHKYKNPKSQSTYVQVDVDDLLNYITDDYTVPSWNAEPPCEVRPSEEPEAALSTDQALGSAPISVADSVKAAAEAVVQQQTDEALTSNGYVFDPHSGLYYHSESGYYYNSEKGLYYDPSSYTYFFYNYDTGEYQFHSKVDPAGYYDGQARNEKPVVQKETTENKKKEKNKRKEKDKLISKSLEHQDGRTELRLWDFMEAFEGLMISTHGETARRNALDLAASYPPCIRAIVTGSDCVDVGMLYLVTCSGTTIGREGEGNHGIPLPDLNISKIHAEVQFNNTSQQYEVLDKGSQNGTFVNDERLSQPKEPSDARPISHGDVIQVGSTKLLCHIHTGSDTCDDCEPGIVMAKHKASQPQQEIKILTAEEKKKLQRQQMNQLKKKYGLKHAGYEENKGLYNNPNYTNRAEERRQTVGSDSPEIQRPSVPSSVHRPISSENVGHKLLQKMGWKEGESLGKSNSGIQEPISVTLRANQAAGLGSATAGAFSADNANTVDMRKASRRLRAQERFSRLADGAAQDETGGDPVVGFKADSVAGAAVIDLAKAGTSRVARSLAKGGGLKWTKGNTEFT